MKKQSIRKRGLKDYLNSTTTDHNGRGYDDFHRCITVGDEFGEPIAARKLARIFNVSRPTVEKWLSIWREEKAKA